MELTPRELNCDLIVLSHLRWDFVFQRPQHLLTRFAAKQRVFYVEEPIFDSDIPSLEILTRENGVHRVVPHLQAGLDESRIIELQRTLIDRLILERGIENYALWYYTPMAIPFTKHLMPQAVVYDCMGELSLFKGAPASLLDNEQTLFDRADVVFTGGQNLYEHKRERHANVHAFPSSIDKAHFHTARTMTDLAPEDQRFIPGPRIGFFGVVDERMDLELVEGIAKARPDWQLVILGPVVKISPATLPRLPNIHWLGQKSYRDLPSYIAGWNVAMMPFAKNESTRFISPTKTPEYLAGGKPVVSTSIRDVVRPYGDLGLVQIADTVEDFVKAIDFAIQHQQRNEMWLGQVDQYLAQISWDLTFSRMSELLGEAMDRRALAITAASLQSGLTAQQAS